MLYTCIGGAISWRCEKEEEKGSSCAWSRICFHEGKIESPDVGAEVGGEEEEGGRDEDQRERAL